MGNDGYTYSVNFQATKGRFNGKSRSELMSCDIKFLNTYQRVAKPRVRSSPAKEQTEDNAISIDAFHAIMDVFKCPICLDYMQEPVRVLA